MMKARKIKRPQPNQPKNLNHLVNKKVANQVQNMKVQINQMLQVPQLRIKDHKVPNQRKHTLRQRKEENKKVFQMNHIHWTENLVLVLMHLIRKQREVVVVNSTLVLLLMRLKVIKHLVK